MEDFTRTEQYLNGILNDTPVPEPYTRTEQYLIGILNDTPVPEPYTREEKLLAAIAQKESGGGGGGGGGGGTDGQFFPMNMLNYVLPTMTLTNDDTGEVL